MFEKLRTGRWGGEVTLMTSLSTECLCLPSAPMSSVAVTGAPAAPAPKQVFASPLLQPIWLRNRAALFYAGKACMGVPKKNGKFGFELKCLSHPLVWGVHRKDLGSPHCVTCSPSPHNIPPAPSAQPAVCDLLPLHLVSHACETSCARRRCTQCATVEQRVLPFDLCCCGFDLCCCTPIPGFYGKAGPLWF